MPASRAFPDFMSARASIDCLSLFHKSLHPAKHALPAFAVIGRVFHVAGKSAMGNLHHCAGADLLRTLVLQAVNAVRLQFPTHDGVLGMLGEIRLPGVD